jgi:hypothetical protein
MGAAPHKDTEDAMKSEETAQDKPGNWAHDALTYDPVFQKRPYTEKDAYDYWRDLSWTIEEIVSLVDSTEGPFVNSKQD